MGGWVGDRRQVFFTNPNMPAYMCAAENTGALITEFANDLEESVAIYVTITRSA